jgi:hypothetical protein
LKNIASLSKCSRREGQIQGDDRNKTWFHHGQTSIGYIGRDAGGTQMSIAFESGKAKNKLQSDCSGPKLSRKAKREEPKLLPF